MQSNEMDVTSLRLELAAHQQEHLLAFWDDLTDDEKGQLYCDLRSISLPIVSKIFRQSVSPSSDRIFDDGSLEPLPDHVHESVSRSDPETLSSYREEGMAANHFKFSMLTLVFLMKLQDCVRLQRVVWQPC